MICIYNIRLVFFLLVFCNLCFQTNASSGRYSILNFGPEDYRAGIQNIDFAQNGSKSLFVANNLGVLSYDGATWESHSTGSGKKKRSLAYDPDEARLYVGSQGEFGYFEESWTYTSLNPLIPEEFKDFDEVWDVFIVEDLVYFCTFENIYVLDNGIIKIIESTQGFHRSFFSGGRLFTQNGSGKLWELKGLELIDSYAQTVTNQLITGVTEYEQGYLFFYNSGLIDYSTLSGKAGQINDLQSVLQGKYINHVLGLSDGRIAISTQTAGLMLVNVDTWEVEEIGLNEGLQSRACLRAFQDFNGNLWLGLQNGISFVKINSSVRLIGQESGLFGSGYDALQNNEGTYFSTSDGLYFFKNNADKCIFLEGTEGPAYGLMEIQGVIYAGHHKGLFEIHGSSAELIEETNGLWKLIHLRSNPSFVVGGTYSGLHLFELRENDGLIPIGAISGFSESSRFFEEDDKGRIWVGQFYKGLYQLNLSEDCRSVKYKQIPGNDSIPIDGRIIMTKIDDAIHLATRKGVFRINVETDYPEKAEMFNSKLENIEVYLLRQDADKNIHVYTDELVGFYRQISPNQYTFINSSLYPLHYSFNNDLLNISTSIEDGIFFNANNGFIQYDPSSEHGQSVFSPLLIDHLYCNGTNAYIYQRNPFVSDVKNPEGIELTSKNRVVNFKVNAFQFGTNQEQRYRYFLDGFDESFGPWVNSSSKEYTNLEGGNYEFLVQAKNNVGEIVTSDAFKFKVRPPFLKSSLFKVIFLVLTLLGLSLLIWFQNKLYKKKVKLSESKKDSEIAKKQQEIIEIHTLKDREIQRISEEKMKSEFRHVNNLLAASTMNLVVKNEFIETIKDELNALKSKGNSSDTKKTLEQIVKEIDITLRLQDDWEQFKHHFDKVHGDFLSRIRENYPDLSPNEQKLCAFLRLNLNTKDIANLMGISHRGVEVARYRLRKKLQLVTSQNLSKFILGF